MNKVVNALSYTGILFFLPLVVCPEEGKFHANQGLIALIVDIVFHAVGGILGGLSGLPLVGGLIGIIGTVFGWAAWLVMAGILVFGIINVVNGKQAEIPVVGKINLINK